MKEKELEKILREMKSEKTIPPADLFNKTMKKIKEAEVCNEDTFIHTLRIKSFWNKKKLISIIGTIMIIMFLGCIRISPALADFVSEVLKMDVIVELINHDKGIKDVIDHNNLQDIDATDIKEGLAFTVNNVLVDQSRMLIFYTLEDLEEHNFIQFADMKFYNKEEKEIKIKAHPFLANREDFFRGNKVTGIVQASIPGDMNIPSQLFIKLSLMEFDGLNNDYSYKNKRMLNSTWTVGMEVNQEKVEEAKEYSINRTLDIQGNKIHLKKLFIYPTRMRLDFQYDKDNTNKILNLKDLKMIDEHGEEYDRLVDDPYAAEFDDENNELESMFFQSNYYGNSKELYLVGKGISVIDKEYQNIRINMKTKRCLSLLDKNMKFLGIEYISGIDKPVKQKGNYVEIKFSVKDQEGTSAVNGLGINNNDFQNQGYLSKVFTSEHFPNKKYNYELTFTFEVLENTSDILELKILDYPRNIKDEFKIKIK